MKEKNHKKHQMVWVVGVTFLKTVWVSLMEKQL